MTEDLNLGLGGGLEPRTFGLHACALNHSATLPIISFFYWIHCQFLLCCSSLQWRYSCSHARSLMINTPACSLGVSKPQIRRFLYWKCLDRVGNCRTTGIDPCLICPRKSKKFILLSFARTWNCDFGWAIFLEVSKKTKWTNGEVNFSKIRQRRSYFHNLYRGNESSMYRTKLFQIGAVS